jgi:RimJ/RimL family protein N-acetyltransferase
MIDSVIIEPIVAGDSDGFFRLIDSERERLARFFPNTTARSSDPRATRRYVKELIAQSRRREYFCFVMRDLENGPPIGSVFLKQFDWSIPKCETAYFISSIYENLGLTSMALVWATDYAFSRLGVDKVYARMVPENLASIRVAEKCGYQREGLLRHDFRTSDDRLLDVYLYGKLRE